MRDETSKNYSTLLQAAATAGQQGQFMAAIAGYQRAIALLHVRYEAWAGLAQCELAARRPEAALVSWAAAIERAPRLAELRCGKAAVHRSLAQPEAAVALYDEALAIDRDCTSAALGRISLHVDAGQLDHAAALLATIMGPVRARIDVCWVAARLALSKGDLAEARNDAAALLATPGLSDGQRGEALLLLGEILGEAGEPAAAFKAAVAGKACAHRLYAELAANHESEAAKSARLGAWWGQAPAAAWSAAPRTSVRFAGEAAAHVFIVGFPRSGTTLFEQILSGHPDVVTLEEAPTLADHYAEFLADDAGCHRLAAISASAADTWRARYWATVAASGVAAQGKSFVDKAPAGTLTLPLIARLFPQAKILFALRDPRDVVLSCFRTAFQMNAMTYAFTSLAGTADCYDAVMAMAAAYRQHLPLPLAEVRHETLVADLAGEVARITAFLGLTPHDAMADFVATAADRDIRTPSARQVRAGLNPRGVGRWRANATDLAPVMPTLDRWVAAFGYPLA